MKKYYLHFVSVVAIAMLSLCAISCGDDDKDDPGSGDAKAELQGTWGSAKQTFRKITSEVKETNTPHITK